MSGSAVRVGVLHRFLSTDRSKVTLFRECVYLGAAYGLVARPLLL